MTTAPDPESDNRARLMCAHLSNGDPEKLKVWLDMLALWPGQEDRRRGSVSPYTDSGRKTVKRRAR
jgi:hypothetical protein